MHRFTLPILCLLLSATAAWAQPSWEKNPVSHAKASLITENTAFFVGDGNWIAIHFKIDPHWHLYWDGVNDSGFAPKVTWTTPAGVKIGELQWPAPKRMVSEGDILDHVYEGEVTLIAPVSIAPEAAKNQSITIKASAEWLVCERVCIPGNAELSIDVPLRKTKEAPAPSKDAPLFAATRARVPKAWTTSDDTLSVAVQGESATVKSSKNKWLAFYPLNGCSDLENPIGTAATEGDTLHLRLLPKGKPVVLKGVVETRTKESDSSPLFFQVQIPAPAANSPQH